MIADFLRVLRDVAGSPLAFAAYVIVAAAWVGRAWIVYQPQARAREILAQYKDDKQRSVALKTLIGENPPTGIPDAQIIDWVKLKSKDKARYLVLVAYVATLGTVIAISAMAVFSLIQRTNSPEGELRIRDKEMAAFELGQAKLVYTQLQYTWQYRIEEKRDPALICSPMS